MNWNGNNGDVIEITIKDSTFRKIDFFRVTTANEKECLRVSRMLKDKYNFPPAEFRKQIRSKNEVDELDSKII